MPNYPGTPEEQERIQNFIRTKIPDIEKDLLTTHPKDSTQSIALGNLKRIVEIAKRDGVQPVKPPADDLASEMAIAEGMPLKPAVDRLTNVIQNSYMRGELDKYMADAPDPAAAAPTPAAATSSPPDLGWHQLPDAIGPGGDGLTPDAAHARDQLVAHTEQQNRDYAKNQIQKPLVITPQTARTAEIAFQDGTKPHSRLKLKQEQSRIADKIEKAGHMLAADLKGTVMDQSKQSQPMPETFKLMAADGSTRAAYMLMIQQHGGADLANLADPAKLKAVIENPKQPNLASQIDIIAKNAGQLGADGHADLGKIAESFQHRQKIMQAHNLANDMGHGHMAQTTRDVILIAAGRTDRYRGTAVAATEPPAAKPADGGKLKADPHKDFAQSHHMGPV